ncbi:MAG TPA: hypothetical protein VGN65_04390, partial [Casimicrobiaceae bacterium]
RTAVPLREVSLKVVLLKPGRPSHSGRARQDRRRTADKEKDRRPTVESVKGTGRRRDEAETTVPIAIDNNLMRQAN